MSHSRTIVETVYTLRDQVLHLAQQNQDLFRMVEEEIAARKKLEAEMREKPQQQILSSDLEGTSIWIINIDLFSRVRICASILDARVKRNLIWHDQFEYMSQNNVTSWDAANFLPPRPFSVIWWSKWYFFPLPGRSCVDPAQTRLAEGGQDTRFTRPLLKRPIFSCCYCQSTQY